MIDDHDDTRATSPPLAYAPPGERDHTEPLTIGNLAVLSLRLLGIYCLIEAAPIIPQLAGALLVLFRSGPGATFTEWTAMLSYYGVYAVAGLVLIICAHPISRRIIPTEPTPTGRRLRSSSSSIQVLAFSVLGVIFAVHGVGEILHAFAEGIRYAHMTQQDALGWIFDKRPGYLVTAIFKTVAGAFLFFGAKRLAARWRRVRGERQHAVDGSHIM